MSTLIHGRLSAHEKPIGIGGRWHELVKFVGVCHKRYAQRKQLNHLSDHMLKDIGISRVDALREVDKHFWQA
ncbi:MAG: DUF1127 domain-containing protein [Gammaproteobacteria bacterium]|nr:DUF1127 domain-containing protein [Gammaproteobacteria bacterium]